MAQDNKVQKNKGPIRFEAIVPTFIIIVGIWGYMHFLFDGHLRKGAEFAASQIHGAEVNIAEIKSSFWGGTFLLTGLEVTDKENPKQNLLTIGKIEFGMLWDALLRMKFVVTKASVKEISLYSPRKKAGWVKPPSPPDTKTSAIEEVERNALNQAKAENAGNPIGDAAKMLEGTDSKDILNSIQGELKSEKRIKELQNELGQKEKQWKEKLENLPKSEELNALNAEIKKLKFDTKDPKQFANDLKSLKEILKNADDKVDAYKTIGSELTKDISKYNSEISQIDNWVKQDINDLEDRLNIPKLSGGDFTKSLFMKMITSKLGAVQKYWAVAEQYMPPPKTKEEKAAAKAAQIVPRKRMQGVNYRFPVKNAYPFFWLKKAEITSRSTPNGFSGDIDGSLTDLSTAPQIVTNPTLLQIKGNFPNQGISGIRAMLTLDHRTAQSRDSLEAVVGAYPMPNLELAKGSVGISMNEAQGSSQMNAVYENSRVDVNIKNDFTRPKFIVEASSKNVDEALKAILASIQLVNLNANIDGPWNALRFHINSNLGDEISAGFQRYVKEKVDALKKKVRDQVEGRVKDERTKLEAQYAKVKGQVDKVLSDKKKDIDKAKGELNSNAKDKGSAKDKAKDDVKQKAKDLLKKLKF